MSSSKNKEQTHLSFIVSHHTNDNEVSNFYLSHKPSYDELQDAFDNFLDECLKLCGLCNKEKKIISTLQSKSKSMQDELDKSKLNIQGSYSSCNICVSCCSFFIVCIMKNNMKYIQVILVLN